MADVEVQEGLGQAEGYEESLEEAIERLAELSDLEYERVRKDEAKKLKIERVSVLDAARRAARRKNSSGEDGKSGTKLSLPDPTPWPAEVDGDAWAYRASLLESGAGDRHFGVEVPSGRLRFGSGGLRLLGHARGGSSRPRCPSPWRFL